MNKISIIKTKYFLIYKTSRFSTYVDLDKDVKGLLWIKGSFKITATVPLKTVFMQEHRHWHGMPPYMGQKIRIEDGQPIIIDRYLNNLNYKNI